MQNLDNEKRRDFMRVSGICAAAVIGGSFVACGDSNKSDSSTSDSSESSANNSSDSPTNSANLKDFKE